MYEECHMHLENIIGLVHLFTWDDDHDVATAQFLVEASGEYVPQQDKVTEHRYISKDEMAVLAEKDETPIYRGAFYAFQYLGQTQESFAPILFFDKLVVNFFTFLNIDANPPKVVISGEKRFYIDIEHGILEISPAFLEKYDEFTCGNIILHQLYHNYRQNILTFDDVKAIRGIIGKNFMFYVDIVADIYTFLFLSARYGCSKEDYLKTCFVSLEEYQAKTLEDSKLTRLVGTALALESCTMKSFDVVLPVLDEEADKLHVLRFDKKLRYSAITFDKPTIRKMKEIFITGKVTYEAYAKLLQNIVSEFNEEN